MASYELVDGTKIEIEDETDLPPNYDTLDDKELGVARAALRLTLNGQLPRRKRLRLRDKEIEMSAHPDNARLYHQLWLESQFSKIYSCLTL